MDRGYALRKTLPISGFPSLLVSGFESRLIHPGKLTRHGAVIFAVSMRLQIAGESGSAMSVFSLVVIGLVTISPHQDQAVSLFGEQACNNCLPFTADARRADNKRTGSSCAGSASAIVTYSTSTLGPHSK